MLPRKNKRSIAVKQKRSSEPRKCLANRRWWPLIKTEGTCKTLPSTKPWRRVRSIWRKDWFRNRARTSWQNWSTLLIAVSKDWKEKWRSLSESSTLRNLRIHFEWEISTCLRANETNHPRQATRVPTLFEQPAPQEWWNSKERKSCPRQDASIFAVNPGWV